MRNFTELVEGIRASFAPHQPLMVFPTRALPRVNQTSGDTQVLLVRRIRCYWDLSEVPIRGFSYRV